MKRFFPFFVLLLVTTVLFAPRLCLAQAVLRAGDTVDIRLSGVPADDANLFNAPQAIDDGGMLNIAYIGKVKIAGLDASQAQQLIETKLKEGKIYTSPTVTITPQSNTRLVNVTGEVKSAGRMQYTADLTVMTAIGAAGGFNDFADKKHVKLTRKGKVQELDTTKFSQNPALDVPVLPGDQIHVPQAGVFPWSNH